METAGAAFVLPEEAKPVAPVLEGQIAARRSDAEIAFAVALQQAEGTVAAGAPEAREGSAETTDTDIAPDPASAAPKSLDPLTQAQPAESASTTPEATAAQLLPAQTTSPILPTVSTGLSSPVATRPADASSAGSRPVAAAQAPARLEASKTAPNAAVAPQQSASVAPDAATSAQGMPNGEIAAASGEGPSAGSPAVIAEAVEAAAAATQRTPDTDLNPLARAMAESGFVSPPGLQNGTMSRAEGIAGLVRTVPAGLAQADGEIAATGAPALAASADATLPGGAQPASLSAAAETPASAADAAGKTGACRRQGSRRCRAATRRDRGPDRAAKLDGQPITPPTTSAPSSPRVGDMPQGAPPQATHASPPELPKALHPSAVPVEIGLRALQGLREFQIRLDPAELGRVEVRLEIGEDKSVSAKVVVERVDTMQLLQRDARTLERAFEQAGLKPSDGGIDISLRDPGQQGRDGDGRARGAWDDVRPDRGAGEPDALPQLQPIIRRVIHRGAVDLSI